MFVRQPKLFLIDEFSDLFCSGELKCSFQKDRFFSLFDWNARCFDFSHFDNSNIERSGTCHGSMFSFQFFANTTNYFDAIKNQVYPFFHLI